MSRTDLPAITQISYNRELTDMLPLAPTRDDLVEPLLPLVPECERRDGDYLRRGYVVG